MTAPKINSEERETLEKQEKSAEPLSPDTNKGRDSAPEKGKAPKHEWATKRFDRISKEEARAIQSKGGKSTVGGKHYTKCITCEQRFTCARAFEESKKYKNWPETKARCIYEVENRHAAKDRNFKELQAFIGDDPKDLLTKIQTLFSKLEGMVDAEPSYTKQTNLLYLMMNIYRLKFGEKAFVMNVNANVGNNPSLDIKGLMNELRAQEAEAHTIQTDSTDITEHDDDTDDTEHEQNTTEDAQPEQKGGGEDVA